MNNRRPPHRFLPLLGFLLTCTILLVGCKKNKSQSPPEGWEADSGASGSATANIYDFYPPEVVHAPLPGEDEPFWTPPEEKSEPDSEKASDEESSTGKAGDAQDAAEQPPADQLTDPDMPAGDSADEPSPGSTTAAEGQTTAETTTDPASPDTDPPVEEASKIEGASSAEASAAGTATTTAAAAADAADIDPLDWPYWRGPRYDGSSPETGLIDSFDPKGGEGSNVVWKRDDLGTRSTPIVMRGRLYTLARAEAGTPGEGERVVCVDAATGETIWENRFNVWLSDVPDTRVGWSSVTGDPVTGNVYALGVCGYFQCINGETGETIWSVPMHENFGLLTTYGGRTNFPVIFEDLVFISGVIIGWGEMAAPCHRFIAFDKLTGEVVWFNGTRPLPDDTTYSAPVLSVLDGQQVFVTGAGDGSVWAFHTRTGLPLWNFAFSRRGLNISPVVKDGIVYTGHSEENNLGTAMGAVVAINGSGQGNISESGEKWRHFELMMGKCSPLVIGDRVYCFDDRAKMFVLDKSTGEQLGRQTSLGTAMRCSPLYADGKIYTADQSGRWYILKPDGDSVETISKGRFRRESVDASPICSHGRVYFTTGGGIYCLADPEKQPGAEALAPLAQETPVEENAAPAVVQVVPAELLVKPGATQVFRVRLFNSRGQFLKESEAEFTADGPGTISPDGKLTVAEDAAHQAVIVTAKVGELAGRARVRVVPPLPWEFTFDGLSDPPITWVGARVRHAMRDVDGNRVMVKITTIPKGTRSRCWFGPSDLSNYTIQADVRGAISDGKMPDLGLIAQGYTIDLQGAAQKLQIRSWDSQLRMASTVDFAWKADTWYTLKLRAEVAAGKAILRGKIWPRDDAEPEEWTVEATDTTPNLSGSPGLFGNAKDAEILIDNVKVYAN